jgi:hypothetical protein
MTMANDTYKCTHWHWDEDDNEYELEALWVFEKNYPEMPNQWVLVGVELVDPCSVELDTSENSPVWNVVEQEGPASRAELVDDRDYADYDLDYGQERF